MEVPITLVARKPLLSFFVLAYGPSWAYWIPLALAGVRTAPGRHTPTFFIVETYRTMTVPMIIGGFGLGICAGAIVLSRVTQITNGSVLAAALWHGLYNMTSTAASRGVIAAVTTTCVMVWALLLVQAARRYAAAER